MNGSLVHLEDAASIFPRSSPVDSLCSQSAATRLSDLLAPAYFMFYKTFMQLYQICSVETFRYLPVSFNWLINLSLDSNPHLYIYYLSYLKEKKQNAGLKLGDILIAFFKAFAKLLGRAVCKILQQI